MSPNDEGVSETWAPVLGFEGRYSVSDRGRVRREPIQRVMRAKGGRLQYRRVNLYHGGPKGGRVRCYLVHVLVAQAFIGECPLGLEVNHKDGDRSHCDIRNLEYVTHAQNMQHAHDTGLATPALAERNGRVKLTESQVRALRRDALIDGSQIPALARSLGVSHNHARMIMYGTRWKHLPYLDGESVRPRVTRAA